MKLALGAEAWGPGFEDTWMVLVPSRAALAASTWVLIKSCVSSPSPFAWLAHSIDLQELCRHYALIRLDLWLCDKKLRLHRSLFHELRPTWVHDIVFCYAWPDPGRRRHHPQSRSKPNTHLLPDSARKLQCCELPCTFRHGGCLDPRANRIHVAETAFGKKSTHADSMLAETVPSCWYTSRFVRVILVQGPC